MGKESGKGVYVAFTEVTTDQFDAAYNAMDENERREFAQHFFVMFTRLIDAQSKVMDEILSQAKADTEAARYVIKYGLDLGMALDEIKGPMKRTAEMWRVADDRS